MLQSLTRPESKRLLKMVQCSMGDREVWTESGVSLGKQPAYRPVWKRINGVAERIVRALFFREKGYRVPEGYEVAAAVRQDKLQQVAQALQGRDGRKRRSVQDGICAYVFKETIEDSNATVWLAAFYDIVLLAGFTRPTTRRYTNWVRPGSLTAIPARFSLSAIDTYSGSSLR